MVKFFPSSTHFHAFWMCHLCVCSPPTVFAPQTWWGSTRGDLPLTKPLMMFMNTQKHMIGCQRWRLARFNFLLSYLFRSYPSSTHSGAEQWGQYSRWPIFFIIIMWVIQGLPIGIEFKIMAATILTNHPGISGTVLETDLTSHCPKNCKKCLVILTIEFVTRIATVTWF